MAWLMHPNKKVGIFIPDPKPEQPTPSEKKKPSGKKSK